MPETDYANDVLVSADWVEEHLDEFQSDDPSYRLLEVNNPTVTADSEYTPYEEGHIPGAIFFHWEEDLSDGTTRDILDKEAFERLNSEASITEDSTVVIYGGGRVPNWFALFAYWEYKYFGHDDVRVIDGGKPYWVENDYPLTTEVPEFSPQEYSARGPFEGIRAYRDDVGQAIESGIPLVDVRSPEEFTGEILAPEGLQETAQRGGHIPGAKNVPTTSVLNDEDGTFKSAEELRQLYRDRGVTEDQSVITYCRVGERSSIAWFALHELLGFEDVENYDGSWTEWGNIIRSPIETGEAE
ncbi:sulfurtransferase [Halobacteriales archaeon QH_2_65_14]|nr:MAG: sulfurtransferase [Halobacteriales archaeon QH_2_65_14]